jgi:hypothetical protein
LIICNTSLGVIERVILLAVYKMGAANLRFVFPGFRITAHEVENSVCGAGALERTPPVSRNSITAFSHENRPKATGHPGAHADRADRTGCRPFGQHPPLTTRIRVRGYSRRFWLCLAIGAFLHAIAFNRAK